MCIECTICYEHLQSSEAIYHTPCGHVFHHACLTQWFERSKTCPECRQNVADTALKRIYLHFSPDTADDLSASLQTEIAGLNHELLIKELEIIESNSNNTKLSALLKVKESEIGKLKTAAWIAQEDTKAWKHTVEARQKEVIAARVEIAQLTKERDELINSSKAHWDQISRMFDGVQDRKALVDMISIMKSQSTARTLLQEMEEMEDTFGCRSVPFFITPENRQMAVNPSNSEIDRIILEKKIADIESRINIKRTSGPAVLRSTDQVDAYLSIPPKKLKTHTTTDCANGNPSVSGGPIDLIDLTKEIVQPVIDLTDTDTVEPPVVNEMNVSWPLAS